MKKFSRVTLRFVLLVTILHLTGGNWFLLQTVAWSNMLIQYSKKSSLSQAISDTFDGNHPCKMCHHIKEAKQREKKQQELSKIDLKQDLWLVLHDVILTLPLSHYFPTVSSTPPVSRRESPLLPPPRIV